MSDVCGTIIGYFHLHYHHNYFGFKKDIIKSAAKKQKWRHRDDERKGGDNVLNGYSEDGNENDETEDDFSEGDRKCLVWIFFAIILIGGIIIPKILLSLPHTWLSVACDTPSVFENWNFRETTFGCENRK